MCDEYNWSSNAVISNITTHDRNAEVFYLFVTNGLGNYKFEKTENRNGVITDNTIFPSSLECDNSYIFMCVASRHEEINMVQLIKKMTDKEKEG